MKTDKYLFLMILYFVILRVQGQDIFIKGYLFDKNNEPVIGVLIILEDDKQIGTVSDADGGFSLTVPYQYQGHYLIIQHENFQDKKIIVSALYSKPFRIIRLEDYHPIHVITTHVSYPVEIKEYSFLEMIKTSPKLEYNSLGTLKSHFIHLHTKK